jgi:hypothetical protein
MLVEVEVEEEYLVNHQFQVEQVEVEQVLILQQLQHQEQLIQVVVEVEEVGLEDQEQAEPAVRES